MEKLPILTLIRSWLNVMVEVVIMGSSLLSYAKSIVKSVKSIEQICQNANQVLVRLDI
jgi:hypothetical protein